MLVLVFHLMIRRVRRGEREDFMNEFVIVSSGEEISVYIPSLEGFFNPLNTKCVLTNCVHKVKKRYR